MSLHYVKKSLQVEITYPFVNTDEYLPLHRPELMDANGYIKQKNVDGNLM